MELTRRDIFKQSLGLVGILSGLTSSLRLPVNANHHPSTLKRDEYDVKKQKVIRRLMRMGYPEGVTEGFLDVFEKHIRTGKYT